jgi:hypothetical protein
MSVTMPRVTYLLVLLCAVGFSAHAQDASFVAAVDRNPVGVGEQFTLSFTLTSTSMGGGKNLQLPDLGRFLIMAGPNQSSSMQFVNGAVSSSVTWSYVLQARDIGKVTIGPASVEAGGKVYKSAPFVLEVVKGTPRPKAQAGDQRDVAAQIGENLFLRAMVDRSHVLQGEQINLTFKLYTRVSVANYAVNKNPALTGFWGEDTDNPKNIALTTETVNGKQYRVGVIRKMALFPTQAGTLEISPMEVQTTVQMQARRMVDPFDAFFRDPFGETVNYTVKSDPLRIKVDPLPAGAPASFKGAVGRFSMETVVDRKATRTNEPVSFRITIRGTGNVKLLEAPAVDLPLDFEQYTPKVTDNISRTQDRISGSKTVEYLLIPRYPGRKTIKPVSFSYFDPSKHEYATITSAPIELTVEQGAVAAPPLIAGGVREGVQMLSQDIRFIKLETSGLVKSNEQFYGSILFLALMLLPVGGFAGAVVFARQRAAIMQDEAGFRNRKALKVAQRGLRQAEHLLRGTAGGKQGLEFYSEVARAMWRYLGDKLGVSPADMSIDRAVSELTRRGAAETVQSGLRSLLEACEMARFAPTSLEAPAMQKTFEQARTIIVDVERTLKAG